jgi:hypothetical protein
MQFLMGGNATFTVANAAGDHYTFKVRKPDERAPFFVSLLSGPDNESSYTYLGIFNPSSVFVALTKASKFKPDSLPVQVVNWALRVINGECALPAGYAIQHAGKCGCCGRKLTHPESLLTGIGPECARRHAPAPVQTQMQTLSCAK